MGKILKTIVTVVGHLIGVSLISAGYLSFYMGEVAAQLSWSGLGDPQLRSEILVPLLLVVVLSAVAWGLGVLLFSRLTARRSKVAVYAATGAVMTETLIVFPVFLLLLMGLSQMGQRSMAGLLTTLGSFQAARTYAVWGPEVGNDRLNDGKLSKAEADDRARIAAALVVTPVASLLASQQLCSPSAEFNKVMVGMQFAVGVGVPSVKASTWSFVEAWGDSRFAARAPTKLRAAYCQTQVDIDSVPTSGTEGQTFETRVTYRHASAFPLVQRIFANDRIERAYTMRSHIPPNDVIPLGPWY